MRRARRRSAGAVFIPVRDRSSAPQIDCYLLHTNDRVRDLVRANIDRSPLFNGQIHGIGPRYCPSLEDKIVRFPDKERHQIFLEPEGVDAREIYVNGFSMSLPRDVQADLVHALPGLEDAVLLRPGYAVEYDFIQPTELTRRLETKRVAGLFLAGPDQRHVRLRGGRGAGPRRRRERRALGVVRQSASSCGATRRTSASSSTT